MQILGEIIIHQSGCYKKVKRWLKGIHPNLGLIVHGYTGWETLQELDVLIPTHILSVSKDKISIQKVSEEEEIEFLEIRKAA